MDQKNSISPRHLYARLGSETAPIIVDVRRDADFAAAATLVAGAFHRSPERIEAWRSDLADGREVVAYCMHGGETSQGVTEALRRAGVKAHFLEGGIAAWIEQGLPTQRKIGSSPSKWVTRERPKIDRIACPWLIRRFIDPNAEFIYVPKDQVLAVAKRRALFPTTSTGWNSRMKASAARSTPSCASTKSKIARSTISQPSSAAPTPRGTI